MSDAVAPAFAHGGRAPSPGFGPPFDGADPYATEALMRWRRTPSELWAADMILPVAEETDRLHACLDLTTDLSLRAWSTSQARREGQRLALQCHPSQLAQPAAGVGLLERVERLAIVPDELVIQIPESLGREGCEEAILELGPLTDGGAQIALDGYRGDGPAPTTDWLPEGSLVRLDPALLLAADEPLGTEILADTTAELRDEGYTVVAEGIERLSQLRAAVDVGIRWVQGQLLERPAPLTER